MPDQTHKLRNKAERQAVTTRSAAAPFAYAWDVSADASKAQMGRFTLQISLVAMACHFCHGAQDGKYFFAQKRSLILSLRRFSLACKYTEARHGIMMLPRPNP